jgi:hypothetical protein
VRDLDLLGEYLMRLRQEKLQHGHQLALLDNPSLLWIQTCAREAELCNRIRDAVKVLASDPGKFIQEFLP